jgi:hypothetical protein
MNEMKGSCLCGAIKYICDSKPLFTAVCHCAACQKSTGSAYSVVVGVRTADFKITGDSLKTHEGTGDSGQPTYRHFCSRCGSTLYAEMGSKPGLVCIKAGTLDNPCEIKPEFYVYWRDHQGWIEGVGELPKHETSRQKQETKDSPGKR